MATTKKAAASAEKKTLTVVMTGSFTGLKPGMKETIVGLGLRRPRDKRVLEDTPAIRGMIRKARHVVAVEGE